MPGPTDPKSRARSKGKQKLTTDQILRAGKHYQLLKKRNTKRAVSQRMEDDQMYAIAASKARAGQLNAHGEYIRETATEKRHREDRAE
jgi:hypothetical protein